VVQGLRELGRVLTPGGRAVVVVPNFYLRTEQPLELRLSYFGWRDQFAQAGLRIVRTSADRGPAILRDHRPVRVAFRAGAKALSLAPGLQYQFVFLLEHAD
jgi:SAM-dependent methyltransferase